MKTLVSISLVLLTSGTLLLDATAYHITGYALAAVGAVGLIGFVCVALDRMSEWAR